MDDGKQKSLYFYFSFLFLIAGFVLGLFFAWNQNDSAYTPVKDGMLGLEEMQAEAARNLDFAMFWQVWNIVKNNYVDSAQVTDQDLYYGALEGIVGALDDPYSVFFDPQVAKSFNEDLAGSFSGIGAEIGIRDGVLTVVAPIVDSPSDKAGLKSGDRIFKVDGEEAYNWSTDKAIQKIRGPKGTEVVLTVARDGAEDFMDIKIVRDTIVMPNLKFSFEKLPNNKEVAYLALYNFNEDSYLKVAEKITEIKKNPNCVGLIFDLRGNPGGYLDVAIDLSSEWVEEGVVVSERSGTGEVYDYPSYAYGNLKDLKTVVLIDEGSASASEIVAGALQDHKKAVIVGQTSFGKGSVQTLHDLADGSEIKLTVAKWLTPNGKNIDKEGIKPDLFVEYVYDEKNPDKDNQLEEALKLFSMSDSEIQAAIAANQEANKTQADLLKEKANGVE
ncbi:MAG TPA: S41 family peptidase [bacterium]|nr:S41 family peptidase [bacterium]